MPRSLSAALQTQVSSTATKTAFLVELNLSTVIRLTDWYSDVTYDSNNYEAGGSFLQLIQQLKQVSYKLMKLTLGFSNITDQVRSLVQDGAFTDKTVDVYLAYFNSDETIVGAINFFTGQIRNVSINENIDSSNLNMTVASHWANWNLTKGRHFLTNHNNLLALVIGVWSLLVTVKEDVRWGM